MKEKLNEFLKLQGKGTFYTTGIFLDFERYLLINYKIKLKEYLGFKDKKNIKQKHIKKFESFLEENEVKKIVDYCGCGGGTKWQIG